MENSVKEKNESVTTAVHKSDMTDTRPVFPEHFVVRSRPGFLLITLLIIFGISFYGRHSNESVIRYVCYFMLAILPLALVKITCAKLELDDGGFTYRLFFYSRRTSWDDAEDFQVFKSSHQESIVWSYSDKRRAEIKMEPLRFRAGGWNKEMWAYWGEYEPKDLARLMSDYRAAYRAKYHESPPIYPVWDSVV